MLLLCSTTTELTHISNTPMCLSVSHASGVDDKKVWKASTLCLVVACALSGEKVTTRCVLFHWESNAEGGSFKWYETKLQSNLSIHVLFSDNITRVQCVGPLLLMLLYYDRNQKARFFALY